MDFWHTIGEASLTSAGFFWKAGWAFILGYAVSGMIQAFVPKDRLTPYLGGDGFKSVSLASFFGAASSSCSFAALAAARSLVLKGAHFVAAIAFMFASTNLVIELGILILIFLGWQFLAAEIIGALLLILISTVLIRLTYPKKWLEAAREKVKREAETEEGEFDWRKRIRSREGWYLVGHRFVSDWKMVWEEILIGFTVAGFVAVVVPTSFWEAIFLIKYVGVLPEYLIVAENAVVAPFVAAATFIGSMGNIPLATVLSSNGVLFGGIMGFIYSDLMVPPLVMINAKYYGWRVALYIAGVMFASIVLTAFAMHYIFELFAITPGSVESISGTDRFALDYTFYFNIIFLAVAAILVWLHRRHLKTVAKGGAGMGSAITVKTVIALVFASVVVVGLVAGILNKQ